LAARITRVQSTTVRSIAVRGGEVVSLCLTAKGWEQHMPAVGEVTPVEAWEILKSDPRAQLVDVRTTAEWAFVGVPDLHALGRQVLTIEWSAYPSMTRNSEFEAQLAARLKAQGAGADTPIVFICRSGARSLSAAKAMAAQGYSRCFNLTGGFEGDLDGEKHRGRRNGWKQAGLAWTQS
jgi:rhodanese-related sulfurtransferase